MYYFSQPSGILLALLFLALSLIILFLFRNLSLKETLILGASYLSWYIITFILLNCMPQLDLLDNNKSIYLTLSLIFLAGINIYLNDKFY